MKFKAGDIIEANRSKVRAKIIKADTIADCYLYEYINPPTGNYKGLHTHKRVDIESNWSLAQDSLHTVKIKYASMEEKTEITSNSQSPQNCNHSELAEYVGFNEVYKYCKKCDEKFYG